MAADSRHFKNALLEWYPSSGSPSNAESLKAAFAKSARAVISKVVSETWTGKSGRARDPYVYAGTAGTAFLLLKASLATKSKEDLAIALEIIEECAKIAAMMREHPSFLLGQPGLYALGAAAAFHAQEQELCASYMNLFGQAAHMPNLATLSLKCDAEPPDELLYGRAGFLWSALFLNHHLGEGTVPARVTQPVVDAILADGRTCARGTEWPLMYEWHGKRYLGAAHGVAGIMHVLLHFPLSDNDLLDVQKTLHQLVRTRFPSGNYPTVQGDTHDVRVHWCHGAPGVALTLCTAARRFGEDEDGKVFMQAALEAGEVVWQRGLLRRRGLCHGVSGNAYVFLALYKLTGDVKHLQRAQAFGNFLLERADALIEGGEMHGGNHPWSLFEGLAGTACLYLDLADPENAMFPGYEV